MRGKTYVVRLALLAVVLGLVAAGVMSRLKPQSATVEIALPAGAVDQKVFSYKAYNNALKSHVDEGGMVNYKALKAEPQQLEAFLYALGVLDPHVYEEWKSEQKIAFWINAYNACTLKAIVDHYPIKPNWRLSLIYPKNSIRQIPGVWDKLKFIVMGKPITLNGMEHEILRKQFNEPRMHMALVCAAIGCPPLRNESYVGERLDGQLDDQARRFLRDPQKLRIDPSKGALHMSPIFKWFGADFLKKYGTDERCTCRRSSSGLARTF